MCRVKMEEHREEMPRVGERRNDYSRRKPRWEECQEGRHGQ
jgi:hypothetical protein